MKHFLFVIAVAILCTSARAEIDYTKKIHPILQKYCASCHNDNDFEAKFSVQDYESLKKGGENGPAFVAGESEESPMIGMIRGDVEPTMPPEDEPRPTDEQIALLAKWIDDGAKGPKEPIKRTLSAQAIPVPKDLSPSITSVDWSASKDVIAISRFQSVELLDAKTLQSRKILRDFPGKVNSVRFSKDGRRLIVASGTAGLSGHVSVWRSKNGKALGKLEGHSDIVYHAVESPDGKLIASASYDRKVILWEAKTGKALRTLTAHNDAIYDLDFSEDSLQLLSASGDQTVKVWNVTTGQRLDTLGQPLKEQFATRFSPDGKWIVGGGRDNRIRAWEFVSRDSPEINPLKFTRFAHEGAIVDLDFTPDGKFLVSSAEDRTVKIWETETFEQVGALPEQPDVCAAVAVSPDGNHIFVARMDGTYEKLKFPAVKRASDVKELVAASPTSAAKDLAEAKPFDEAEPNDTVSQANALEIPGKAKGVIDSDDDGDVDLFRFRADKGQSLVLTIRAARAKSQLDSRIEILDIKGKPVPWVVLRAVRDSYFTFRGKDSNQSGDFRVRNWEEMNLNDYLYANGEVVKLFHHPRGPDSGFNVYSSSGKRRNYFGTTATSHALHEPCYIVRPYPVGTKFQPNGLPTFEVNYDNDDDSRRELGDDSRLVFTAPESGEYIVRVSDVRGFAGPEFHYELSVAPPAPSYSIKASFPAKLFRGSGMEFSMTANRKDGFEGAVRVDVSDVPEGVRVTTPLMIEANHTQSVGTIHVDDGARPSLDQLKAMKFVATAKIGDEVREQKLAGITKMEIADKPKVRLRVVSMETSAEDAFDDQGDEQPIVFETQPGTRILAKVIADRINHKGRISFGNETSGRNLPHGAYVDDIGLNGLMITAGNSEQRFFITVEDWVQPMTRTFHVKANDVEGQASIPCVLKVVPRE